MNGGNRRRDAHRRQIGPAADRGAAAHVRFGGRHRQALAEVHGRRQLRDGCLTSPDLLHGSRPAEPGGKRFLARLGPCDIQQLEQRSRSEQIEIPRIGVIGKETRPVRPGPHPGAVHPRDATAIQLARADRPLIPLQ
jgi:hypothetical protein